MLSKVELGENTVTIPYATQTWLKAPGVGLRTLEDLAQIYGGTITLEFDALRPPKAEFSDLQNNKHARLRLRRIEVDKIPAHGRALLSLQAYAEAVVVQTPRAIGRRSLGLNLRAIGNSPQSNGEEVERLICVPDAPLVSRAGGELPERSFLHTLGAASGALVSCFEADPATAHDMVAQAVGVNQGWDVLSPGWKEAITMPPIEAAKFILNM